MIPLQRSILSISGLITAIALILLFPHSPHPGAEDSRTAFVSRVVDGDTVILSTGESVRYIGIDAPEMGGRGYRSRFYAREAAAHNRELVEGRWVILRFDVERRDAYGRLLAYVFAGERFVNADMVRYGYARTYPFPPNLHYYSLFQRLEGVALREGVGMWRRERYDPIGDD